MPDTNGDIGNVKSIDLGSWELCLSAIGGRCPGNVFAADRLAASGSPNDGSGHECHLAGCIL